MRLLKRMLVILAAVLILLVVVGLMLPSTAKVERSIRIDSPTCTVYSLVNGFQSFNKWSPWFALDPDARYSYEGPVAGPGAKISWFSENPNLGSGSQTIVENDPDKLVRLELDFGRQGKAKSYFRLEPEGAATSLTWGFETDFGYDLPGRYYGLFFDSMVGGDYARGLENLKNLAESLPRANWCASEITVEEVVPFNFAYFSGSSAAAHEEIEKALAAAYREVQRFMRNNGLRQNGPPICVTLKHTAEDYRFEAGIPVDRIPAREPQEGAPVQIRSSYGGTVVRAIHRGSYAAIPETYAKIEAFMAAHNMEEGTLPWEQYVSDPATTPEAERVTNVYYPVK